MVSMRLPFCPVRHSSSSDRPREGGRLRDEAGRRSLAPSCVHQGPQLREPAVRHREQGGRPHDRGRTRRPPGEQRRAGAPRRPRAGSREEGGEGLRPRLRLRAEGQGEVALLAAGRVTSSSSRARARFSRASWAEGLRARGPRRRGSWAAGQPEQRPLAGAVGLAHERARERGGAGRRGSAGGRSRAAARAQAACRASRAEGLEQRGARPRPRTAALPRPGRAGPRAARLRRPRRGARRRTEVAPRLAATRMQADLHVGVGRGVERFRERGRPRPRLRRSGRRRRPPLVRRSERAAITAGQARGPAARPAAARAASRTPRSWSSRSAAQHVVEGPARRVGEGAGGVQPVGDVGRAARAAAARPRQGASGRGSARRGPPRAATRTPASGSARKAETSAAASLPCRVTRAEIAATRTSGSGSAPSREATRPAAPVSPRRSRRCRSRAAHRRALDGPRGRPARARPASGAARSRRSRAKSTSPGALAAQGGFHRAPAGLVAQLEGLAAHEAAAERPHERAAIGAAGSRSDGHPGREGGERGPRRRPAGSKRVREEQHHEPGQRPWPTG